MKLKNISALDRAMGILEGVLWTVDGKLENCLQEVVGILFAVRCDEQGEDENAE